MKNASTLVNGKTYVPGCRTLGIERTPEVLMSRFRKPYLSLIPLAESWNKEVKRSRIRFTLLNLMQDSNGLQDYKSIDQTLTCFK